MPYRYLELLRPNETELISLLNRAAVAYVSVEKMDQVGNTLLYYALQRVNPKKEIVALLFDRGAFKTLFKPDDDANQPYNFVVMHGHNDIQRLIHQHCMRDSNVHSGNPAELFNMEVAARYAIIERELLENCRRDLDNYIKTILPRFDGLLGILYTVEFIEQQRKMSTTLLNVILPIAIAAHSWTIYGDAIQRMLSVINIHIHMYTVGRSDLKLVLLKHINEAEKKCQALSSWRLLHQMSFFLKMRQNMQDSQPGHSATHEENESLKAELVREKARAEAERMEKENARAANERAEADLKREQADKEQAQRDVKNERAEKESFKMLFEEKVKSFVAEKEGSAETIEFLLKQNRERLAEKQKLENDRIQWENDRKQWQKESIETKKQMQYMLTLIKELQKNSGNQGNREKGKDRQDQDGKKTADDDPKDYGFTPGYNEEQGGSSSSQSNNGQREQAEGAQHRL
jgi:hypothetical protein